VQRKTKQLEWDRCTGPENILLLWNDTSGRKKIHQGMK